MQVHIESLMSNMEEEMVRHISTRLYLAPPCPMQEKSGIDLFLCEILLCIASERSGAVGEDLVNSQRCRKEAGDAQQSASNPTSPGVNQPHAALCDQLQVGYSPPTTTTLLGSLLRMPLRTSFIRPQSGTFSSWLHVSMGRDIYHYDTFPTSGRLGKRSG